MIRDDYKNILRHYFWANFDVGVIAIFLSLYIWDKTQNMITVAIAFIIPIVIDTVVDYFFSGLSDKRNRVKLIIAGNVGSSIFLGLYGAFSSIYLLYLFIFLKSLFAKLYETSIQPYLRETIDEEDYKEFLSKGNIQTSVGASVGGFSLMFIYGFTENISLIFMIAGLIELYSTVYLLKLGESRANRREKTTEDSIDIDWIRFITWIYTIEGFGIALIINRIIIYMYEFKGVEIHYVGLIFFIVYGISSIISAKLYKSFSHISLKNMFVISFIMQAGLLALFTVIDSLYIVVAVWFFFELVSNITDIYSKDRINKSLFTNIGRRLSKFRITIAIGNMLGQLLISRIWDNLGVDVSFYFSSIILLLLSFFILFQRREKFERSLQSEST